MKFDNDSVGTNISYFIFLKIFHTIYIISAIGVIISFYTILCFKNALVYLIPSNHVISDRAGNIGQKSEFMFWAINRFQNTLSSWGKFCCDLKTLSS